MATTTQQKTHGVKEIAKLFPSLMKIKQKSLREKVAAVWNEAITTGCGGKGWTFAELRAVKFTLLAGDKVERSIESIIFHHADFVDFDIAKFLGKRAAKK